jgi:hypothetical protein
MLPIVSRRFPAPETGRLAVKVINQYGDDVLQRPIMGAASFRQAST